MSASPSAIVIGAGIGGLAAAAALAAHFPVVTIIDKDRLPEEPTVRKSIQQGGHISILLQAGLNLLGDLLPGMPQELIAAGSAQIHAGTGQKLCQYGLRLPRRELGLTFLGQSRPFLEHHIRRRVSALPATRVLQQTKVESLLSDGQGRITGVRYTPHAESTRELHADLVIDAAGLSGPFVRELGTTHGLNVPSEVIETKLFYSTVHFAKPQTWDLENENLLVIPEWNSGRAGGSLLDVEGHRWCISLHGRGDLEPPKNWDEWLAFAEGLPDPIIMDRIRVGTPLTEVKTFRKPRSTWRRFDQVQGMPAGYLPLGDTITSFNPIFGQGMTVALGHAQALRDALAKAPIDAAFETLRGAYLEGANSWSQRAWRAARSYDALFSATEEQKKNLDLLRQLALSRLQKAQSDPAVHLQLVQQAQMLV